MKRNKTKTQHNLEKLATQSTQDERKQKHNTTQRNWQHRVHKMKRNKTKTQHNLEKLATQSTQDEEKQNKNTTQPRETGNIEYTR